MRAALDAPRRASRTSGAASRSSARWPSSATSADGYHRAIGELAAELDVEVIGVGEPARAYRPVVWAPDVTRPSRRRAAFLRPGDAVLVKASRAVGLEGIADEIANFARAWSPS